jgi:hypothetical protein
VEQRVPRITPPSIPAVIFTLLLLIVPVGLQTPLLNSDGDLARHLRHGRYMLEHGGLIRHDPFSFTRAGAPFVGFEYGSQVLYALAERVGGLPAVALLAGLLIATTYALLTRLLLRLGVDPLLAYASVAVAAVLGVGHWTARPHLFSYVAVVLLVGLLERRPRGLIPLTAALCILWANVHGGFVYGWILIGLYLAGSAAELWWGSHDKVVARERVRLYAAMLATAIVVTLLNPHGLGLHRHLFEFFGKPYLFDNTAEFTSPDFHEASGKVFLVALLLSLTSLAVARRRPSLPHLLVICAGVALALISVRNIPLFGLTAVPLLALHFDPIWRSLPDPGGFRGRFANTAGQTSTWPWVVPVLILACLLAISRGRLGSKTLIADGFDGTIFPVAAVQHARSERLQGRLFSEFAWGGYVLYAWPEQKIFIDGGTDFFGEELFREYATIKRLVPGWRNLVRKWDLSLMLLRRESSLAHELAREPSWQVWYCDSLAVVLKHSERSSSSTSAMDPDSAEARLDGCAPPRADSGKPSEPPGNTNQGESPGKTEPAQQRGLDGKDARQELVGQSRERMHI